MNYPSANEVNVALLVMGVLVTTLGLFSAFLKAQLLLTEPIAALGVGVLLGPAVLNWVDLTHWGNPDGILEQGARGAIAIQLMALALERGGACDLNSGVSAHSGCAAGEVAVGPLRSLKDALFIGWFGPILEVETIIGFYSGLLDFTPPGCRYITLVIKI
ncbi:MAG TPA: hypothetical protein V6D06_17285 [Trichocoleus sp.]